MVAVARADAVRRRAAAADGRLWRRPPAARRLRSLRSGNAHLERVFKAVSRRVLGPKINKNLDLPRATLLEYNAAKLGMKGYTSMGSMGSLGDAQPADGHEEDG